jgi:hypothetical protein
MQKNARLITPAILGVALICFLMPFVTAYCGGQVVATFSGVELATGKSVAQPDMFGQTQSRQFKGELYAVLALICGCAALILAFLPIKKALLAVSGCSAAGMVLLLLLKAKLDNDALAQGGMLKLEYKPGFWLALLLYLSSTIASGYFSFKGQPSQVAIGSTICPAMPSSPRISGSKCAKCGASYDVADFFCAGCGADLRKSLRNAAQAESSTCWKCNSQLQPDSKFCFSCGAAVKQ